MQWRSLRFKPRRIRSRSLQVTRRSERHERGERPNLRFATFFPLIARGKSNGGVREAKIREPHPFIAAPGVVFVLRVRVFD